VNASVDNSEEEAGISTAVSSELSSPAVGGRAETLTDEEEGVGECEVVVPSFNCSEEEGGCSVSCSKVDGTTASEGTWTALDMECVVSIGADVRSEPGACPEGVITADDDSESARPLRAFGKISQCEVVVVGCACTVVVVVGGSVEAR